MGDDAWTTGIFLESPKPLRRRHAVRASWAEIRILLFFGRAAERGFRVSVVPVSLIYCIVYCKVYFPPPLGRRVGALQRAKVRPIKTLVIYVLPLRTLSWLKSPMQRRLLLLNILECLRSRERVCPGKSTLDVTRNGTACEGEGRPRSPLA